MLRGQCQCVAVFARDSAVVCYALGRGKLVERAVPGPGVGLKKPRAVDRVGPQPHVAHDFYAAGYARVDLARPHQCRHYIIGLLSAAALRVDGGARHGPVAALRQPGVARDVVRLFARLRDATADYLVNVGGLEARPLADGCLHAAQQVGGVQAAQLTSSALAARYRASQRFYYYCFGHRRYLLPGSPVSVRCQSGCPSIIPLVGTPTPPVTSTWSLRSGWLTESPRIKRTPSLTPFMPCM